jgi:hypothetical protein
MLIPANEAISLLRKWHQERTLVQCALYDVPPDDEHAISAILGYIERVDERNLLVDAKALDPRYGKYFSCTVKLSGALYHFGDSRDTADESAAESFKTTHECFLAIMLPLGGVCEILATKPSSEIIDILLRKQR